MQVLYIAGYPRTGSTLIGNTLNELPGVVHLGEVTHTSSMLAREEERCGCGVRHRDCPFWTSIQRRVPDLRDWPALYDALEAESGATWMVDSSKTAAQLRILREVVRPEELRVLHLLRDPRASIHSRLRSRRAKQERQGHRGTPVTDLARVVRDAKEWVDEVDAVEHSDLELRYEDFAADPRASLRRILELLGEPLDSVDRLISEDNVVELGPNHGMAGNKNRFRSGPVPIRADHAWETEMPRIQRVITGAVAGRAAQRHGYHRF